VTHFNIHNYLILPLSVRVVQSDLIRKVICILTYSDRDKLKRIGIFLTLCPWGSDNADRNRFSNTNQLVQSIKPCIAWSSRHL